MQLNVTISALQKLKPYGDNGNHNIVDEKGEKSCQIKRDLRNTRKLIYFQPPNSRNWSLLK